MSAARIVELFERVGNAGDSSPVSSRLSASEWHEFDELVAEAKKFAAWIRGCDVDDLGTTLFEVYLDRIVRHHGPVSGALIPAEWDAVRIACAGFPAAKLREQFAEMFEANQ